MTHPFSPEFLRSKFAAGTPYAAYVASGKPHERENWGAFHARVHPTPEQRSLIAGFSRHINVLCISGTWCGDCVQQCPFLAHIEAANVQRISVRFLDRDKNMD